MSQQQQEYDDISEICSAVIKMAGMTKKQLIALGKKHNVRLKKTIKKQKMIETLARYQLRKEISIAEPPKAKKAPKKPKIPKKEPIPRGAPDPFSDRPQLGAPNPFQDQPPPRPPVPPRGPPAPPRASQQSASLKKRIKSLQSSYKSRLARRLDNMLDQAEREGRTDENVLAQEMQAVTNVATARYVKQYNELLKEAR